MRSDVSFPRFRFCRTGFAVLGLLLFFGACSGGASAPGSASGGSTVSSSGGNVGATGGSVGSGGGPSASGGGAASSGGVTSSGGASSSGGATSPSGGSTGSSGGRTGTGGGAGSAGSGGASATGGQSGAAGRAATGGSLGTGGATPGTGGNTSPGTGGATNPGTGGAGLSGKIYYVTPTGKATNDGKSFATAMDYPTAFSMVRAGETVLLQMGTYLVPYKADAKNTLVFAGAGQAATPIRIFADGGRALFDFQFPTTAWVQDSYGFSVTGSYHSFKGIGITRAGYQGVYVTGQHNTFENCAFYENRNTGLEINEGGAYTTVINCDAYRNYDPKKNGSMADGFGPKQTQGPGNKFIGCRSWENSDDAYDAFDSPETVTFENCWAFRCGTDFWNDPNYAGNGNGFKVGGNAKQANHKLTNCVAFGNRQKGFDQNNNTGGLTIYNSISYNNGINFGLGGTVNSGQKHDLKNNISLGGGANTIANATEKNNSWNTGLSVAASDLVSVDLTEATAARNADGSLPDGKLFRLKAGSALIDAGIDVGSPFKGKAPDVGAFESNY